MTTADVSVFELGRARVAFSSRHGGVSHAPYNELNIGSHVGDEIGDVLRNRELLHQSIGRNDVVTPHNQWLFLNQTHENNVVYFNGSVSINNSTPPTADASITKLTNQPLVVMTADCGPLVIAGESIVAVVHASWRTTVEGIIGSVIDDMYYYAPGEKLSAILGPCIHPQSYEFEEDLLKQLSTQLGSHVVNETVDGKPSFDLPSAIQHECSSRDVSIRSMGIDTFTSPDHFSYRRDNITGRQCVVAWLAG